MPKSCLWPIQPNQVCHWLIANRHIFQLSWPHIVHTSESHAIKPSNWWVATLCATVLPPTPYFKVSVSRNWCDQAKSAFRDSIRFHFVVKDYKNLQNEISQHKRQPTRQLPCFLAIPDSVETHFFRLSRCCRQQIVGHRENLCRSCISLNNDVLFHLVPFVRFVWCWQHPVKV